MGICPVSFRSFVLRHVVISVLRRLEVAPFCKLLTYPFLKPTFCLKCEISVNVGLGEGYVGSFQKRVMIRNDRNRFLRFLWKDVSLCVSVSFKCVHFEIFEVDGLTIFLQHVALLAFDLQDARELGNKGL